MAETQSSGYLLDASTLVEASRLISQDRMITDIVSLLPPNINGKKLQAVLDVGCGPGGWLLDLVTTYPQISGIGIDDSELVVAMANRLARAEGQEQRLTFRELDARTILPFKGETFDLVHIRLAHAFFYPKDWQFIFQETMRLLKHGGLFCITDLEDLHSQKPAVHELYSIWPRLLYRLGRTFSPDGRSIGLLAALPTLADQAGFVNQQLWLHAQNTSFGEKYYAISLEDHKMLYASNTPETIQASGYTPEAYHALHMQAFKEMAEKDFVSISTLFTFCWQK